MGDAFERELKRLLSYEDKAMGTMLKTCDADETRGYRTLDRYPFVVIRAAGSLGVDLVAIRGDLALPIEVKSSATDTLRFSRNQRLTEQADHMRDECLRADLVPIYAFRLKGRRGDPWRIFTLPMDSVEGRLGLIQRRLPTIEENGNGNLIMRWNDGMKLSRFIEYLAFLSKPESDGTAHQHS